MKTEKEKDKSAEPATPASKPKAKRKRERDGSGSALGGSAGNAVPLAELTVKRIEDQLVAVRKRAHELLEAQRGKPSRWQYFGMLATLEDRLRQALAGNTGEE